MAVRKAIISILIVLTAAPAVAVTKAEWDLQFVEGLARRGYIDIATEQGQKLQQKVDGPQAAKVLLALARTYVNVIPSKQDFPEEQQQLIDKAQNALEEAVKLDPKLAEDIDYLAEVAQVHQQIAVGVARKLADVQGAEKQALIEKVDKLFEDVVKEFDTIVKKAEQHREDLYDMEAQTDEERAEIEQQIDEAFIDVAVFKLRKALAHYAWLETFDYRANAARKKELAQKVVDILADVEWEGSETSLVSYAAYYKAMVNKKLGNLEEAINIFDTALKELPEALLVPDILGRIYLDYADTLIEADQFTKAVTTVNQFRQERRAYAIGDNRPRALLYKATALFELSMEIERTTPDNGGRAKEARDVAIESCRTVMEEYPRWTGTAAGLISKYADADTDDPIVLMDRGQSAYRDERYREAARYFRKVMSLTDYPKKQRVYAGYYLVLSYYKQDMYYETAAASEMLMACFDPDEYPYSQQSFTAAIAALQKQWEKSGDDWDRERYMNFRSKLGEERFKIFVARQQMENKKFDQAIETLRSIPQNSDVYPTALFMIAECTSEQAKQLLAARKRTGFDKLAEAVKLYKSFLQWSQNNPADDATMASRQDVEARAIVKLGQLLTMKVADKYYLSRIKAARYTSDIETALESAAAVMGEPAPEETPASKQAAAKALKEMVDARYRYVLKITENFADRYPDAEVIQPYAYHIAVTAATALGKPEVAEDALIQLAEYKEFQKYIPSSYYSVGGSFDEKARALEAAEDSDAAEDAYKKALDYYLKWWKQSPDAADNFEVLYYIAIMLDAHGKTVPYDERLEFFKSILDKQYPKAKPEKMDRIRLAYAKLLTEGEPESDVAYGIYEDIYSKYNEQYELTKAEDPKATRPGILWEAWQARARMKKLKAETPEEYEEAAVEFSKIRGEVPRNTDTWWQATHDLAGCLIQMKRYESAVDMLSKIQKLYPSMGGPQMKKNFQILLDSMLTQNDLSDTVDEEARNLISNMINDEENQ